MNKTTKSLVNAIFIIMLIFFAWVSISTIEVIASNLTTAEYSAYNFYEVATEFVENIK